MVTSPVYRENYQLWLEDKVTYEKIVSEDVAVNYASFPRGIKYYVFASRFLPIQIRDLILPFHY